MISSTIPIKQLLQTFLKQAQSGELKTSSYPKELKGFNSKVSFGMGAPARIPWIAFTAPEITVSNGYFPVYLYYKSLNTLLLAYGVSETNEYDQPWTKQIVDSEQTIESFFGEKVPRYGDSFVYRAYMVEGQSLLDYQTGDEVAGDKLESDLDEILSEYQKATNVQVTNPQTTLSQGVFYLEKQLEDFIVANWESTELGGRLDLIIEEGELKSQQYRTDVGPIDILAKDKTTGAHVVIELKKNQTNDDTVGQLMRYMGWIEKQLGDADVTGIIIAKGYSKGLELAINLIKDRVTVYEYEVDFKLHQRGND